MRNLLAVDAADGMIAALEQKLRTQPGAPENVKPLSIMLEDPEDPRLPAAHGTDGPGPRMKFDLVISHLVLHHIADLRGVLTTMLGCLKPGGSVALTDFEDFGPEARRFHPEAKIYTAGFATRPAGGFTEGGHNLGYWRRMAGPQLEFVGSHF